MERDARKAWQLVVLALTALNIVGVYLQSQPRPATVLQEHPHVVTLTITERGFEPSILVLRGNPGSRAKIQIDNQSSKAHGFRINIGDKKEGLVAPVPPNNKGTFDFVLPSAGRFEFYSPAGTQGNEAEKGFQGIMIIQQ
jgi:hypothetical protein